MAKNFLKMAGLAAILSGAQSAAADQLIYAYNDKHDGYELHHIHIRDLATGKEISIGAKDGTIWNAQFLPSLNEVVYTLQKDGGTQIHIVNADGTNDRQITNVPGMVAYHPSVSPDGKRIAFSRWDTGDAGVVDRDGGNLTVFAPHEAFDYQPVFFTDGKRLLFGSDRTKNELGEPGIFILHLESGEIEETGYYGQFARPSHDGTRIVFGASEKKGDQPDIYVARLGSNEPPRQLTDNDYYESQPAFTPGDDYVVFVGRGAQPSDFPKEEENETQGVQEVFMVDLKSGAQQRISHGGAVAWHAEVFHK